jgi:hypothetical protein
MSIELWPLIKEAFPVPAVILIGFLMLAVVYLVLQLSNRDKVIKNFGAKTGEHIEVAKNLTAIVHGMTELMRKGDMGIQSDARIEKALDMILEELKTIDSKLK